VGPIITETQIKNLFKAFKKEAVERSWKAMQQSQLHEQVADDVGNVIQASN